MNGTGVVDVAVRPLAHLALCDGIGGFDLGLRLAGVDVRTVCRVEWETYAAATLVARMEEQTLDRAPVWDDLSTFPGKAFRGKVDLVTAGFPCQPWSTAGKRRKTEDERWIWADIAKVIREVEPGLVFLENVPGITNGGLEHVLGDLAEGGFDAEWDLFRASDVGAPHKRERWLLLAVADTHRAALREQPRWWYGEGGTGEIFSGHVGGAVANTHGTGLEGRCGPLGERGDELASGAFWPPPPDSTDWADWDGPQPGVRRDVDGIPDELVYRTDRLRVLGNGVVPQMVALAWQVLSSRLIA